mgnify:CR=1 FL=1
MFPPLAKGRRSKGASNHMGSGFVKRLERGVILDRNQMSVSGRRGKVTKAEGIIARMLQKPTGQ